MSSKDRHINFTLLRDRVLARAERSGKDYWRSLQEMTDAPEFEEFVAREFPQHAEEWHDPVERRQFLKIMGASLALAGLTGCAIQPEEKAVPAVKPNPNQRPGKAAYYATAMPFGGLAVPLLVRSNDGRPTKVEGNDQHPASLGASDMYAQASILGLYDPDRSQNTQYRGDIRRWTDFVNALKAELETQRAKQGAGIRFLTEAVSSPTVAEQIKAVLAEFPQAKWYQYEPVGRGNVRAGTALAFGQPANVVYDFGKAERVFSIDADFLAARPGNVAYIRQFAEKRKPEEGKEISRVYAVETTPTTVGFKADHRLALKPSQIEGFVRAVAQGVGVAGVTGQAGDDKAAKFAAALAKDLKAHAGKSLVIAGDEQPALVHALAHAINETLNNVGQTVRYTEPLEGVSSENPNSQDPLEGLKTLVGELWAGQVEALVIMGANPMYDAPGDLNDGNNSLKGALEKAKLRIHHGLYFDETAELCHWHVPATHYLEMWSDARAYDGTVSIVQPLIAPLYDACKSPHELLNAFVKQPKGTGYETLRAAYQAKVTANFDKVWNEAVHNGVWPNSAATDKAGLKVNAGALASAPPKPTAGSGAFEVVFRADPNIYDGRFANNGWLQELPKPLTKITWDNVGLISPRTAKKLNAEMDFGSKGGNTFVSLGTLDIKGKTLSNVPLWVMPGQPDDVVTVFFGYGRKKVGALGNGIGYNAYKLRTSETPWFAAGATLTNTKDTYEIASTQTHFTMENRNVVHEATLAEFHRDPKSIHAPREANGEKKKGEEHIPGYDESLFPKYDYKDQNQQPHANQERHSYNYAWGMAIDVASCVGCNACIVACQSENNIPVVGKEQVARSREMQWLRVDAYFKTAQQIQKDADTPTGDDVDIDGGYFIPMPCMQCENAPCEIVCPVHATVHSSEGLNDMVYNRCVGTRYCSNNCPYKVRRFNFFLYQDFTTPQYQIMRNPEVSVRSRGVMEKCTYCVQRIQNAKITAEVEGREVRDGDILTACQSVCPANAITFGNQNDAQSAVAKLKQEERNYGLLPDLNTQPRTTYLGTVSNPNEELSKG
jgi:molybdopterin-containing oxidoreductase family iron-sulfur binding subunit